MYHLSRAWYWHLGTTIPREDGTKILVPRLPERLVTKIIYCCPLRGWYWNLCTIILTRLAFDLRATLETHQQSYLSLILSSHRKCCDMWLHATANAKVLFTGLFRTASTAPSPAAPHIWKFPTPRSLSWGCAAWSALTVWHSEHANYTIPGRFPSIFFAITYVYSLCVLLIGCILAVKSEKVI